MNEIAQLLRGEHSSEENRSKEQEEFDNIVDMLDSLQETRNLIKHISINRQLVALRNKIEARYTEHGLNKAKYQLYAIFPCYRQASDNHSWICIYDWEKKGWLKYNDDKVATIQEDEIFCNTVGEDDNAYYFIYGACKNG
jgi:hypothetical protein